jgi:hypothetical protein
MKRIPKCFPMQLRRQMTPVLPWAKHSIESKTLRRKWSVGAAFWVKTAKSLGKRAPPRESELAVFRVSWHQIRNFLSVPAAYYNHPLSNLRDAKICGIIKIKGNSVTCGSENMEYIQERAPLYVFRGGPPSGWAVSMGHVLEGGREKPPHIFDDGIAGLELADQVYEVEKNIPSFIREASSGPGRGERLARWAAHNNVYFFPLLQASSPADVFRGIIPNVPNYFQLWPIGCDSL